MVFVDTHAPQYEPAVVCRHCGGSDRLTLRDDQFEHRNPAECAARLDRRRRVDREAARTRARRMRSRP